VISSTAGLEVLGSTPAASAFTYFATPGRGTRQGWLRDPLSGLVAGPVVRAGRVGPASQVGQARGTRQSGRPGAWDPPVRSARRVGPASQVAWDPRVRSDRHVGPVCQVGLTKFKCMTDGSYIPRKINGFYTLHKKN
jgi:hypothetical protein